MAHHNAIVKSAVLGATNEFFAQFLVSEGIDSISVTPDSLIKTIKAIHAVEAGGQTAEANGPTIPVAAT